MKDLIAALGLVLVIEGLIWAVSPNFGQRVLSAALEMSESSLRLAGAVAVALGVFVVWLVRG